MQDGYCDPVTGDPDRDRLEAAKQASWAQLLFKCARLMNERSIARMPAPARGPRIRAAHTALFPHIDLQGTRQTELARRLGVSKQAVGQLVDELVEAEVLERAPDPSDGRAKLVKFVQGGKTLLEGMAVLRASETEIEADMPAEWSERLRLDLLRLLARLEAEAE